MFKFAMTLSFVLLATLFTGSCTKGAKIEDNANAGQANRPGQSAPAALLLQPTLKGDIERISLHISMAREAFKNNKLQEAVGQLEAANKEVDAALGRKPRLREELEALKTAIERAIGTVDHRDKDADSQLAELQVRIGAIKTNTP
jgi:hypothetical protein